MPATIRLGGNVNRMVTGPRGFGRTPASRLNPWKMSWDGTERIKGKLNSTKFVIKPTNEALLGLQKYAFKWAKDRSPRQTGATRRSIVTKTDKAIFLRYADVVAKPVKDKKGFPYSFALDAARKRAPRGMAGKGEFARVRRYSNARRNNVFGVKRARITLKNAPYKYSKTSVFKGRKTFNWFHGVNKLTKRELKSQSGIALVKMRTFWGGGIP